MPLADVLRRYFTEHASKLRTAKTTQVGLNQWLDFWGASSVADMTVTKQEEFHAYLRGLGLKDSSVMRVITMGKAAVNRSFKRGEIKAVPYILTVKAPKGEPMGRPMEIEELKRLYAKAQPHLRIFIAWMLATAARPEAILELHSRQVDWGHSLIDLNPPGRVQNKKFRPIVKLIPYLAECRFDGFLVVEKSKRCGSVKKAWNVAREAAGLDDRCNPYSLRHTAARWLRLEGVDEWSVATQLGHRRPGQTETYTAFHPDYLKTASAALDKLVRAICAPLPTRRKYVAIRNKKEVQRDKWWAHKGSNLGPLPCEGK